MTSGSIDIHIQAAYNDMVTNTETGNLKHKFAEALFVIGEAMDIMDAGVISKYES